MADKYLNTTGLQYFYNRIKTLFASKTEFNALDEKVDGIISTGGEPNVIEVVKKNGTALTVTNKAVDVIVPTKTSELTNDGNGTSNFATESYVNTYGGKIDVIKKNGAALPITNKAVDISVPTTAAEISFDSEDTSIITTSVDDVQAAIVTLDTAVNQTVTDISNVNLELQTGNYVKDASYVHTDNNFTSTLLSKLNGIAANAEVNVQSDWNVTSTSSDAFIKNKPTIPSKVSDLTNDSGFQTASQVSNAIAAAVSSAYIYKGSVATVADLPASGNTIGDVYDVQATGVNYAWNGTAWDALGSYVDTSLYWAKSELTAITTAEIDTITAA